jgi:hypothetical protein
LAVKTPAELQIDYQNNLPDNTSGLIQPEDVRQSFVDTTDSWDAQKVNNTQDGVNRWNANKIQDRPIDPALPLDKQVLVYNGSGGNWEPSNISDSVSVGYIGYVDNLTATPMTQNLPAKIEEKTFTSFLLVDFDQPVNGRLRYTGLSPNNFLVLSTVTIQVPTKDEAIMYIAKNGTIINDTKSAQDIGIGDFGEISLIHILSLNNNDYIEIFMENPDDNNDFIATNARFIVKTL